MDAARFVPYERLGHACFGMSLDSALERLSAALGSPDADSSARRLSFGSGSFSALFDSWGRLSYAQSLGEEPSAPLGTSFVFDGDRFHVDCGCFRVNREWLPSSLFIASGFPCPDAESAGILARVEPYEPLLQNPEDRRVLNSAKEFLEGGEWELGVDTLCFLAARRAELFDDRDLYYMARMAGLCYEDGTGYVRPAQIDILESIALKNSGQKAQAAFEELSRVKKGQALTYGAHVTHSMRSEAEERMHAGCAHAIQSSDELCRIAGGLSFGSGMLKILTLDESDGWGEEVRRRFPCVPRLDRVFAYDWRGRLYCDAGRGVFVLDPDRGACVFYDLPFGHFLDSDEGILGILPPEASAYRSFVLHHGEVYRGEVAMRGAGIASLKKLWDDICI